jgi:hypothetical protein
VRFFCERTFLDEGERRTDRAEETHRRSARPDAHTSDAGAPSHRTAQAMRVVMRILFHTHVRICAECMSDACAD